MTKTTTELKAEIQKTVQLVHTLRDEARVKLHLAGMDIKEAWSKLEPKVADAEKAAEDVSDATLKALKETAKRLEKLVASL